jgi:hypothetical protein
MLAIALKEYVTASEIEVFVSISCLKEQQLSAQHAVNYWETI